MDKAMFVANATPLVITLGTRQVALMPRHFVTGSIGWFANGATVIDELAIQYTITLVVKGTRDASADGPSEKNYTIGRLPGQQTSPATQGATMTAEDGETPQGLFQTPPAGSGEAEKAVPAKKAKRGSKS